jgi:hypothetical protein
MQAINPSTCFFSNTAIRATAREPLCAVESRNGAQGLLGYVYCAGADRGFHDAHLVVAAGDDSDWDVQLVGGVPE